MYPSRIHLNVPLIRRLQIITLGWTFWKSPKRQSPSNIAFLPFSFVCLPYCHLYGFYLSHQLLLFLSCCWIFWVCTFALFLSFCFSSCDESLRSLLDSLHQKRRNSTVQVLLRRSISPSLLLTCITHDNLSLQFRTQFLLLFRNLYLDTDPFDTLPRLMTVRVWTVLAINFLSSFA